MPIEREPSPARPEQIERNGEGLINQLRESKGTSETTEYRNPTEHTMNPRETFAGYPNPEIAAERMHQMLGLGADGAVPQEQVLRRSLLSMTKNQIDQVDSAYKLLYGRTLQNEIVASNLNPQTIALTPYLMKGRELRTNDDIKAMTDFALTNKNFGLFEDVMRVAPAAARAGLDFDLKGIFKGPNLRAAEDLIKWGTITAAEHITRAEGNFPNNSARIDHFLRKMTDVERQAYSMGRKLSESGGEIKDERQQNALDYYNRLHGIFTANATTDAAVDQWDRLAGQTRSVLPPEKHIGPYDGRTKGPTLSPGEPRIIRNGSAQNAASPKEQQSATSRVLDYYGKLLGIE